MSPREISPRDVGYGFEVVGELPTRTSTRTSEAEANIARLKTEVEVGQAARIGDYKNRTAATAQVGNLRRRHGQPDAEGLQFAVGRIEEGPLAGRTGIFAIYNPKLITDEGQARQVEELKAWKASQKEKAQNRKAAKAAAAPDAGKTDAKPTPRK